MILADCLSAAIARLSNAGIGTARLDALVLLEDCLGRDRASLLAHPELKLTTVQIKKLDGQIKRRAAHEPLAYIRGKTEFYGRDFIIDHRVLEPRPESETMIDLLKKLARDERRSDMSERPMSLADIGSGSGCLGITAALELGLEIVDFYDIDASTLEVARNNAKKYHVHGTFHKSDLLDRATGSHGIILANLPYVPDTFHINEAAMREPSVAIFGGHDGLNLYRRLFAQLEDKSWSPRYVLTEALPPQHEQLAEIAANYGFSLLTSDDFIQVFTA